MFCIISTIGIHGQAKEYSAHPLNEKYDCDQSSLYDANTTVTFFGDSHGQFVRSPLHGISGWPPYLALGSGGAQFNVQNLAVGTWTTKAIFQRILDCAGTSPATFYTARRYAVEAGGNDLLSTYYIPLFMPWKINDMRFWMMDNQRLVLKLLKVMIQARSPAIPASENPGDYILFFSNMPVMARGPVSGTIQEQLQKVYWNKGKLDPIKVSIGNLFNMLGDKRQDPGKEATKEQVIIIEGIITKVWDPFLAGAAIAIGKPLQNLLQSATDLLANNGIGVSHLQENLNKVGVVTGAIKPMLIGGNYKGHNQVILSYLTWLNYWAEGGSVTSPVSMMLALSQGDMEKMAQEEKVKWLETYYWLVHPQDCALGQCYVANYEYYTEFLHANVRGYAAEGFILGAWMKAEGWDKPLSLPVGSPPVPTTFGPAPVDTTFWTPHANDVSPPSTTPPVADIDWGLLLWLWWCITTGSCG